MRTYCFSILAIATLGILFYIYQTKISEINTVRQSQAKELAPLNDTVNSLKTEVATLSEGAKSLRDEAILAKSVCMSNTYCIKAYNSGQHSLMELSPNPKPPYSPKQ